MVIGRPASGPQGLALGAQVVDGPARVQRALQVGGDDRVEPAVGLFMPRQRRASAARRPRSRFASSADSWAVASRARRSLTPFKPSTSCMS